MKNIFKKSDFPKTPGGNIYEWQEAETGFEVHEDGMYVVAITASAKSAEQNRGGDDDDLRMAIDDYELGKYEVHEEKISWKGFGTSSSFDGASLKGGTKTVYLFIELQKGRHILRFFADETPTLRNIDVYKIENNTFELNGLKPAENIQSDKKGIPWMSFVFFGPKSKEFSITSTVKSATQKGATDGDNLKVVINGKIQRNQKAKTSDKYRNFYFSGDLNHGASETLEIACGQFEFLEDSVELWYDQSPNAEIYIKIHENLESWLTKADNNLKKSYYHSFAFGLLTLFKSLGWKYSHAFLKNALNDKPKNQSFDESDDLAKRIKQNSIYQKIINIIKIQIKNGVFEGQVILGDKVKGLDVALEGPADLKYSLHGFYKLDFCAKKKTAGRYRINITLYDVYDFSRIAYELRGYKFPLIFANNQMDAAETAGVVRNFEIKIKISDVINIEK